MKLPFFAIALTVAVPSFARDLPPAYRIENLQATNDSVQTSLIFQTIAGVRYTVQRSHDFQQWDPDETFGTDGEIYGMGHECALPMREFTPPPAPPPGGNPPPSSSIAVNVSVRFARCSDPGGGTVASWPSLTGSGSASVLIAQDMDDGWDSTPLYYRDAEEYRIFVWHPVMSAGAPAADVLAQADSDFRDVLVAAFPAMDAEVDANQAAALNAPPPAPPDPNAKVFWRVKADWTPDTDADGSPDWAEFEMQADPNHPFHALADAFNDDVDNNGVADGVQLDLDGDQTPDAMDIEAGDPVVTYVKEPEPRYAIFPITGVEPPVNETAPIQINDQGRVLYVNGTWSGAGWTPLTAEGANLQECEAFGMNDFGDIIGRGSYRLQEDPEYRTSMLVHWTSPVAQPVAVVSGEHHAMPTYTMDVRQMTPGPVISNDRKVIAQSFTVDYPPQGGVDPQPDPAHRIWTINGASSAKGEEVPGMIWISDALTYWGVNSSGKGKIKMPERVLDDISFVPRNVVEIGPDVVAAFSPEKTDIAFQGAWLGGGGAYANVLDISQEGVAISRTKEGVPPAVLLNGQWRPVARTAAFDVPQDWRSAGVEFLDTSSFGWLLARKEGNPAPDHAAMLPVRLEARFTDRNGQTVTKAAGVDDVSTGADLMEAGSKDRIWIMAPQGVAKTVVWTSPLAGANPLQISGAGLKFGGAASAELSGYQSVVNIQADPGPSGTEVLLDLKLGGTTASVSKPVGVKVMKQRTIKLAVYKVTKAATATEPAFPAVFVPDAQELEDYLNDIYRPQLNVSFDVKVEATPLVVGWDVGTVNKSLDGNGLSGILTSEQSAIVAKKNELLAQQAQEPGHTPFDEHFALYLVGCQKPISTDAFGVASRLTRTCWVIGSFVSRMDGENALPYDPSTGHMHTIAHEIGHILVGPGHPDEKEGPGPAELVGTNRKERLMASGSATGSSKVYMHGKVLVKGEWDAADGWMTQEENGGRL